MQKKFWSALLSLAMIVSCFSGAALASGGENVGQPSYQLTSPNNVNLDMNDNYGSYTTSVIIAPGAMNFSGSLMPQGTESPTSYMKTSKVNDLWKTLQGSTPTTDKTLVFGELADGKSGPMFSNGYQTGAIVSPSSTGQKFMVTPFKELLSNRLLSVDADGRFNFNFIPEPHTTKYFGFALSDMLFTGSDGLLYGVFESTDVMASNANLSLYERYSAAKAVYDALVPKYNDVLAKYATYKSTTDTAYTQIKTISDAMKAYVVTAAGYAYDQVVMEDLISKAYHLQSQMISFNTNSLNVINFNALAQAIADSMVVLDNGIYASRTNFDLQPHSTAILTNAVYSAAYTAFTTDIGQINGTIRDAAADEVNLAATGLGTFATSTRAAYDAYVSTTIFNGEMQSYLNPLKVLFGNLSDSTRDFPKYMSEVDDVSSTTDDVIAAFTFTMNQMAKTLKSLEATAGGSSGSNVGKQPQDRYLQADPLTVQFKYKLKDGAMSFTAGTSGNLVVSGTFVDANGNAVASVDDFKFNVYAGSNVSKGVWQGKSPIAVGQTQNGYFSFTIYGVYNEEIYLYPTTRYDRMALGTVNLDITKAAERFSYVVATYSRRPFVKAELEESTAVSTIKPMPIQFKDLYTYESSSAYTGIRTGTSTNLRLYGVSYVVYGVNTDGTTNFHKSLGKEWFIRSPGTYKENNVDWDWDWVIDAAKVQEINESAVGITPSFNVDSAGNAVFNGDKVHIMFTGTGTASVRARVTGRYASGTGSDAETKELYQSVVNIVVDGPSAVNVVDGNVLKRIVPDTSHKVSLRSLEKSIDKIVMTKIRYDNKPDTEHTLVKGTTTEAKDYKLTYETSGKDAYIYLPWNLVEVGGGNIEIDVDIFDSSNEKITSRTIVIKNELWKVTSSVETITVRKDNNFTATLVDHNDVEQNNSVIHIVDTNTTDINPLARNVVGNIIRGAYEFKNVNPRSGGDVYLYVHETREQTSAIKAMISLQALGLADYVGTWTEGKDKAVVGLAKSLEFSVVKADGAAATDMTKFDILGSDLKKTSNFSKYENLIPTANSNGKYTLSVVGLKPGTYILRAATSAMEHYVDMEFEVLPLTIQFPEGFEKLTWSYNRGRYSEFRNANHLVFTVLDPLTDAKVNVSIVTDSNMIKYVKADGEASELDATIYKVQSSSSNALKGITLTDKDYLDYKADNSRNDHDFFVEVVDARSDVVRTSEGDLGLKFYFKVKDQNSVGTENIVDGFTIPVVLPTLTANPEKVVRGVQQTIELTVLDANGKPLSGVAVRPDVETNIAELTNTEGKTNYLFTAIVTGITKRFDIAGFERSESGQVYTIVKIEDDNTPPTLILDPYISKTTKNSIVISGTAQDNLGLSKLAVDNTLVNITMTNETSFDFEFTLDLRSGINTFRIVVTDVTGRTTTKTLKIEHLEPSVSILTLNSTEVNSSDSAVSGTVLDTPPTNVNGRVCLPLRFVFETILKGTVDYAQDASGVGTITANAMGHEIVMTIGSTTAYVDGKAVTLLVAPFIEVETSRALAPIREILEAAGVQVAYDATSGRITIVGAGDVDEITTTDLIAPADAVVAEEETVPAEEETTPAEEETTPSDDETADDEAAEGEEEIVG